MIMMSGSLICFKAFLICFDALSGFGHYVVSIGFWNSSSKERCVFSNSAGGIGMAWQDSSVNVQLESARCLGHLGAMSDVSIFFLRLLVFSLVFLCDCGVGCVCSFTYHSNWWDLPHKWSHTASEKRLWIHTMQQWTGQHVMPLRS